MLKLKFESSSSSYSVFIWCCSLSRDGWIYPVLLAIACTPSFHLSHLRASSFKPIFSVSSSTCFFQVFFGHFRFLFPLTLKFRATLNTLLSFLLSTCPYHLTQFAVANQSTVSFYPSMSICSSVVFLSTIFLTAHGSHHSSLFLKLLFHSLLNTMPHFHTVLLILCNNDKLYLSSSEETYFQAITLHITQILLNRFLLITSPFLLMIGTITLVFHLSGIHLPSNTS